MARALRRLFAGGERVTVVIFPAIEAIEQVIQFRHENGESLVVLFFRDLVAKLFHSLFR